MNQSVDIDPLNDVDLLTEIVRAMVEIPEAVRITEKNSGDNEITLWIDVAPTDRGKIIGKAGRNITSLRTLFSSIGALEGRRLIVMVVEPGKTYKRPPRQSKPVVDVITRKQSNVEVPGEPDE